MFWVYLESVEGNDIKVEERLLWKGKGTRKGERKLEKQKDCEYDQNMLYTCLK